LPKAVPLLSSCQTAITAASIFSQYSACSIQAFRHTVATEPIANGAPITVVQAQMRLSDVRATFGLYWDEEMSALVRLNMYKAVIYSRV
jgi:site-specific recombinase XerD